MSYYLGVLVLCFDDSVRRVTEALKLAGPMKLYTLYAPPEHKDGVVQTTKADADARHAHEEWDGGTTE